MTARLRPSWPRRLGALAVALSIAAAWGALVQTQFNLQALTPFVEIPFAVRLTTSLQDLAGYGPVQLGLVAAAWLAALPVAMGLGRRWPRLRTPLYALAAGIGLVVAIRITDAVAPMPVLIDATRGLAGLLGMAAGSALGGGLFAHWTRSRAG
ncbi:hypothetical protein ACF3M1_02700 [Luteimonas sp. WGS1318]|uniref:hypothetical protein n=1 Tax=Luteimonas sp. WGS1318 TaxID=3366815 RepID=UPI00372CF3E6